MYSVSKACLNVCTKLLQTELSEAIDTTEKEMHQRVFAVCPGNFESQMSTADERANSVCVDEAAQSVIDVLSRPWSSVAPGQLYRNGQMISF